MSLEEFFKQPEAGKPREQGGAGSRGQTPGQSRSGQNWGSPTACQPLPGTGAEEIEGRTEDTPGGKESPGDLPSPPLACLPEHILFPQAPGPLQLLEGPSCPSSLQTTISPLSLGSSVPTSRKPTLIPQASVPNPGSLEGFVDGSVSLI